MKKIVWVLGANGMLGSMVFDYLSQQDNIEVFGTVRDADQDERLNIVSFDADQPTALRHLWQTRMSGADYIINCIGAIKPRITQDSDGYLNAIRINSELPHRLAELVSHNNTRVIHASTDCVFSGKEQFFYEEDSFADAMDIYGLTKHLGESPDNMNLRTSIIGPEINGRRQSLWEWYTNCDPNTMVDGFTNHTWNGITTLTWAKIVHQIIENNFWFRGVQHIYSHEQVSKYELLRILQKEHEARSLLSAAIVPKEAPETKFMCLGSNNVFVRHFDIAPIAQQVREMLNYVETGHVCSK